MRLAYRQTDRPADWYEMRLKVSDGSDRSSLDDGAFADRQNLPHSHQNVEAQLCYGAITVTTTAAVKEIPSRKLSHGSTWL